MAYETKNGDCSLFKNAKYEKDGKMPYLKGKGKDLQGNDIELAAWLKTFEKDGKTETFFQVKIQPAYVAQTETVQTPVQPASDINPAGSEMPF